ncbi:MAG: cytochrome-c peroxidase [Gammaproteobacteria bacterium]
MFKTRTVNILALALCFAIGTLSGCTKKAEPFWSEKEVALLRSISLSSLSTPPDAPSNRIADDPRAVALGQALFFDQRLSRSEKISCATCHQPELQFSDGLEKGQGINRLGRNTPGIIGGAWQSWFYWDGRRDSLWAQALIPIEAPDEMGGSRTGAVRLIMNDQDYRKRYTSLFGPLPPSLQLSDLPEHAGEFTNLEGKDSWYRMPKSTQDAVNRSYANIGKTIAAFERTLTPKANSFDRYVESLTRDGEQIASSLLGQSALRGAKLFIDLETTRCLQCHNGPLLTNGDFHNIGTATALGFVAANTPRETSTQPLDFGRLLGVQAVLLDQFNCLGKYSDAKSNQCSALRFLSSQQHGDIAGAFKTPSLRNVAQTAPYFHHGLTTSIKGVLQHYNSVPDDNNNELTPMNLGEQQLDDIVAFLNTLNSPAYAKFPRSK